MCVCVCVCVGMMELGREVCVCVGVCVCVCVGMMELGREVCVCVGMMELGREVCVCVCVCGYDGVGERGDTKLGVTQLLCYSCCLYVCRWTPPSPSTLTATPCLLCHTPSSSREEGLGSFTTGKNIHSVPFPTWHVHQLSFISEKLIVSFPDLIQHV